MLLEKKFFVLMDLLVGTKVVPKSEVDKINEIVTYPVNTVDLPQWEAFKKFLVTKF